MASTLPSIEFFFEEWTTELEDVSKVKLSKEVSMYNTDDDEDDSEEEQDGMNNSNRARETERERN
ncbi:MAG: hypothetical protein GY816_12845 [Cytophagales bacterium]|nr:hypothetical protein [Cytophagales bacterium]